MTSAPRAGRPRADQSVTSESKSALRARLQSRRQARPLSEAGHEERTARALAVVRGHRTVACYASVGSEPPTWALMDALRDSGVRVLVPVLRREPDWAWYQGRELTRPGWQGIPEPVGPRLGREALAEASLIWASGLAGTPRGDRLGTGGGWYDRALAWAAPPARVGMLLYDDELLDWLPTDPWDRPVQVIVTESRLVECHPE